MANRAKATTTSARCWPLMSSPRSSLAPPVTTPGRTTTSAQMSPTTSAVPTTIAGQRHPGQPPGPGDGERREEEQQEPEHQSHAVRGVRRGAGLRGPVVQDEEVVGVAGEDQQGAQDRRGGGHGDRQRRRVGTGCRVGCGGVCRRGVCPCRQPRPVLSRANTADVLNAGRDGVSRDRGSRVRAPCAHADGAPEPRRGRRRWSESLPRWPAWRSGRRDPVAEATGCGRCAWR